MKRVRVIALSTASYSVLLRLMGPMQLRDIERIVNKAIYQHYPWGTVDGPATS